MAAYYNEIDPFAAAWLRELIKAGLIADGEVDERSITDVQPDDLRGFVQCHFFAGIGGWSYALRLAGWPDDREVWTGSCPCQPFSTAGRGDGPNDSRHFWPTWFRLIIDCHPDCIFGEQVASADGRAWFDAVCADLEASSYAVGAADLPACSIGAPHGRQRLWFVAESDRHQRERNRLHLRAGQSRHAIPDVGRDGPISALDDSQRVRAGRSARSEGCAERAPQSRREDKGRGLLQALDPGAHVGNVADTERFGLEGTNHDDRGGAAATRPRTTGGNRDASAVGDVWADAEWLACRDGKARPVESGTFPMAHGVSGRVAIRVPVESATAAIQEHWYNRTGALKGFGNAIVPQVAQVFIEAYCDARGVTPC